ncbi:MAG: hypothetical protein ABW044_03740 [Cellvibrio sp.]
MFNFGDHLQELRSTIVGFVLILAATIIGFVWISIGIYFWLSSCLGAVWGPLVLGLIYFIPIIVFAFYKAFARPVPPQIQPQRDQDINVQAFSKTFENLSNRSPLVIIAAAAVASFLATRFPALLAIFTQLLATYTEDAKSRAEAAATMPPSPDKE